MQAVAAGTNTGSARNVSDMYPMSTMSTAAASGQCQKMGGGGSICDGR